MDSITGFLYGNNGTRLEYRLPYFPYLQKARLDSIPAVSAGHKLSIHYVCETSAVKFITLQGVVDIQSSCLVYFAPFKSTVWLTCLALAFLSLAFEMLCLVRRVDMGRGLLCLMCELVQWKFASFLGQHSSPSRPSFSFSGHTEEIHQRYSKGIIITSTVWFITSTILISNYGAFFSAESLRSFPYRTGYKHIMDLENFTLYFLVNEQKYFEWFWRTTPENVPGMFHVCARRFANPPECEIAFHMDRQVSYYRKKILAINRRCRSSIAASDLICHRSSSTMSDLRKRLDMLKGLHEKSLPVKNSQAPVENIIEGVISSGTAAAFVTYDYEFRSNWAIFMEVMKRHPGWKIANNFESVDKFGVQTQGYLFTAGLHERYRRRFEGRLKVLLGSGIYQLWSKWQRIRLSNNGLHYDEKTQHASNGSPGDPLSFGNSATWWLVWAQRLSWLAAFAVFTAEISIKLCRF